MPSGVDEDALLDAIQKDGGDATRAVYADWLEEHGDKSRAEYVRLEVRAHALAEEDAMRGELGRRLERLGRIHDAGWLAKLARPEEARVRVGLPALPPAPPRGRQRPRVALDREPVARPPEPEPGPAPGPTRSWRELGDIPLPSIPPARKKWNLERYVWLTILLIAAVITAVDELRWRMKNDNYIDLVTPSGCGRR